MSQGPRIAITTGALRVPPTYFVLQHAERLKASYEFEAFARIADVTDPAVTVPVHSATAFASLSYSRRARLAPAAGAAARRQLERFDPRLIHQHFGTWSHPAIAVAGRNSLPLITTLHGYDVVAALDPRPRRLQAWHALNVRDAYAASARILAVSGFLAERAIASGAPADRIVVHYQGIDTDYFSPGESRGDDVRPTVLFVGALAERKGVRDLLKASVAISGQSPHDLLLVGSGPIEAELRALAVGAPHVRFAGSVARDEVREAMRAASVLVLPTHEHDGWREAAGLVLLEAQACETPVIAYASGGTPEMVRDGVTGLLVPENNREALREALSATLAMSAAARATMGTAARKFVVGERSLATSAAELAGHYDELIAG